MQQLKAVNWAAAPNPRTWRTFVIQGHFGSIDQAGGDNALNFRRRSLSMHMISFPSRFAYKNSRNETCTFQEVGEARRWPSADGTSVLSFRQGKNKNCVLPVLTVSDKSWGKRGGKDGRRWVQLCREEACFLLHGNMQRRLELVPFESFEKVSISVLGVPNLPHCYAVFLLRHRHHAHPLSKFIR